MKNLRTPTNYAYDVGQSRQHVNRLINSGKLPVVEIDGIKFVDLTNANNRKDISKKRKAQ